MAANDTRETVLEVLDRPSHRNSTRATFATTYHFGKWSTSTRWTG